MVCGLYLWLGEVKIGEYSQFYFNMNSRSIFLGMSAAMLLLARPAFARQAPAAPAAGAGTTTSGGAAEVQFETPVFEFGTAQVGDQVKHDFVFTNTGNATLIVSKVEPKCGCTVARPWTREVEPGKTGVIPILLNTAGLNNGPVTKYVGVTSNAKNMPAGQTMLQLKGAIHTLIEATPLRPVLNVISDSETNAVAVVKIVNHGDIPVTLSEPQCGNSSVTAKLKTIQPGKEFELELKTASPLAPGNGEAVVTMKTSLPQFPVVTVQALLFSRPALMVTPSTVMLPPGPATNVVTSTIRIYNLSTAHPTLTLSDLAANVPGVGVKMREAVAGKQFELMMTFPPGFEVPKGSNVEITVKSSHPQFAVIRVPVIERPMDLMPKRPNLARPGGVRSPPQGPRAGQP